MEREVLYHALRTLTAHPGLTFVDLAPLLVPMSSQEVEWRERVVRAVTDGEIRNFWQRFENQPRAAQDRITQPVMDRIWQLNARPEVRNIIGQSESSFQMDDVVRITRFCSSTCRDCRARRPASPARSLLTPCGTQ